MIDSRRSLRVAEPASHYARRPRRVVDASLLAAVLFEEENAAQAAALMQGWALCAPSLVDLELTNVALNKVRRGLLPMRIALAALDRLGQLDLERFDIGPRDIFRTATRAQLTAYDAAYLHLAVQLDAPLATLDLRLAEAAQRLLGGGDGTSA